MAIPDGHLRLHWDEEAEGIHGPYTLHTYQDCQNLHQALELAAIQYANGYTITRLENWMGEDAAPLDQVIFAAKARCRRALELHDLKEDRATMEASPIYGIF